MAQTALQDQLDVDIVKRRSVTGILAITFRTFFLQVISLVAVFLLTVFLSPEEYGIYFVVSAVVNFLIYFSDIGLAAALIQKSKSLKRKDLITTFTIQQTLVVTLVTVSLILSRPIANFYHLSPQGLDLFRALIIAFFLSSLKTIPSVQLERKLEFGKLIIPQITENIVFYSIAVFMAWKGQGVQSFSYAVLFRGLSGLIAIYILAPWKPKLGIYKKSAQKLLKFGVPFQLNSLLALVKDDALIAFLGKVLPLSQVGYLGWAQRWSLFPLRMFMDSINKVTFPSYSRIQNQKDLLKKAIEKSLLFISLLIFPLIIGMVATAPAFVRLIPKYQKWAPALIALALYSINSLWSSISTTLTSTLAALGKIKINLKLMVLWTTLTWILTPLLIFKYGYNGAALASALVASTSFIVIFIIKKVVPIRVLPNIFPAFISSLAMGVVAYRLSGLAASLTGLAAAILISGCIYLISIAILQGSKIIKNLNTIINIIRPK